MTLLSSYAADRRGTAALEFAIMAPVFLMLIFGIVAYGIYLGTAHAVQQIASDAARTAIAGLNATERRSLANRYIASSTLNYAFLDTKNLAVAVRDDASNTDQFTVTVTYDSSHLPIWNLFSVALPNPRIVRFSTIRIGGL